MATLTDSDALVSLPARRSLRGRFLAAFVFGLLAVLALAAGASYAFDRGFDGRVLPGVHVGSVDLSGATAAEARVRLETSFGSIATGSLVLSGGGRTTEVGFGQIGRAIDVNGLVAEALAIGRSGSPIERVASNVRTAVRGVTIAPRVTFDAAALEQAIGGFTGTLDRAATGASVTATAAGFSVVSGADGQTADARGALATATTAITDPTVSGRIPIAVSVSTTTPTVTTDEARAAMAEANLMARDIVLSDGSETWTIPAASVRPWISFTTTADGSYAAIVTTTGIDSTLTALAAKIVRAPANASFLTDRNGAIVGVTAGSNGRALDIPTTTAAIADLLRQRSAGVAVGSIPAALTVTKPTLSTEDAQKSAPLMRKVSSWTTYFPIYVNNGFGNNIWIPALDINGYVVGPGQWFDFWKAVGPITRARGYTDGGAIINGHTEPQGALAGGICSTSTTLFNAALRAGFQMGARLNHYYYISRYPLGLDATVFKSSSGATQTMSWLNDTQYPVIIRAYKIRNGNAGYVRFELWTVPNGRTVKIDDPIVKNVVKATDTVQYTASLPAGTSKRVEYPTDGKDVWRTVTVYQNGAVIRSITYYSHYARITGLTLIGTGGASTPAPSPVP